MFCENLLIAKRPFQDGAMSGKSTLFMARCQQAPKACYFPAEREDLTASKMNCSLPHYLALQFEALVILLQETYCTNAEKSSTSKLQTSWVFLKQEGWACQDCPQTTKIYDFGPISTDIED